MNIWRVLGLEPTRDLAAIRRAYAAAAKKYHPEEQPEEFQRVRKAYEQALAYARSAPRDPAMDGAAPPPERKRYAGIENKTAPKKGVATGGTYLGPTRGTARSERPGPASGRGRLPIRAMGGGGQEPDWLREETAAGQAEIFSRGPAMTAFQELWRQEKKRGDKGVWREYFSSPDFLAAQREEGFAAALLEFVEGEVKSGQSLPRRLLLELAIVYGVRYNGKEPVYLSFAAFPGIDHIRDLLLLGQPLDRLSHEEDKIWAACWQDYFELLSLAKSGGFEDAKNPDRARRWKDLFHRYRREKLTARPEVTRKREEEVEFRHPYGLRLLAALVRNHPLTPEAVQYLYDDLQLETMASGSAKKDYKPLLDALLPILPDQTRVKEEKEALAKVKNAVEDFMRKYCRRFCFPHTDVLRSYDPTPSAEEKEEARAVVEMPEFQRLLFTRRLEESGVPDMIFGSPTALATAFAAALVEQIKNRSDDPVARAMVSRCLESSGRWAHDPELFFDRPYAFSGASPDEIAMDNREFWHYYLSTAFPAAVSTDREEFIGKLLEERHHPSLWWRRAFTGFDETAQRITAPRSRIFSLGPHQITVEFHFHYQVFLMDGEETAGKFSWEEFLALTAGDELPFWLFLPLAMGKDEERPAIRRELAARLKGWELYAADAGKLADCLVNHIAATRRETAAAQGYREDGHALYGYRLRPDRRLEVYRAYGILRHSEIPWEEPFGSVAAAEMAAEKYIRTLLAPPRRLLQRESVAGLIPLQKAKLLVECLGEQPYTQEDRKRDEGITSALATDDFLGYGVRHHGSYTADFYRRYLHRPYWAAARFGSQEGERFALDFRLEIWPFGSDRGRRERRGELLTQLGMLGEAAYFIGAVHLGKTRYSLISNSLRRTLFAVREGTSHYHAGKDLAALAAGMLTQKEWEAVEFVERYENGR